MWYPRAAPDDLAVIAANALNSGLSRMLGHEIGAEPARDLGAHRIVIGDDTDVLELESASSVRLDDGAYRIERGKDAIIIEAVDGRALVHGAYGLLEALGARFTPWADAQYPPLDPVKLMSLEPHTVTPAFSRRAFVSDLMTWHYEDPARLHEHLEHDLRFIQWMAARGLNAFLFIRHARDTLVRIDELAPILRANGVVPEYGGHVMQLLLPRELYGACPNYFPARANGERFSGGNLCASNTDAMELVRANALSYARNFPEMGMLHVWGADLWEGGWCRCAECGQMAPQEQYMTAVNAIADSIARESDAPVAYLAYHDTLEPDPALRPRENVCFEWAPRERCYAHAIGDVSCERNRRYFEWLKRYIELFDGRGMVFEYYADAILFGGLGFATPSVIRRDLEHYRSLGIDSISCLTFGAYSAFAYPVNLEAFARGVRALDFDPELVVSDVAGARHPLSGAQMASAYRAIEKASALVLSYGDVLRPFVPIETAPNKRTEIRRAIECIQTAISAAELVVSETSESLTQAERELWRYSAETLAGIADYLRAWADSSGQSRATGEAGIARLADAAAHIRGISPAFKGTWGCYDLDRFHQLWLEGLRRRLNRKDEKEPTDGPPA
ncbi:MAG: DUF4838 domain-containing protein [Candidatus Binataceae bacterium]